MNSDDQENLRSMLQNHSIDAESRKPASRGNEENTKNFLIHPFIKCILKFNTGDPAQVQYEYNVGHKKDNKVDYALMTRDKENKRDIPIIFVEAKPVNNDNLLAEAIQILQYGQLDNSVYFLALTNGIKWFWYKKDETKLPYMNESAKQWSKEPFLEYEIGKIPDTVLEFFFYIGKQWTNEDGTIGRVGLAEASAWADNFVINNEIRRWLEDWIKKQKNPSTSDSNFLDFLARQMADDKIIATPEKIGDIFPNILADYEDGQENSRHSVSTDNQSGILLIEEIEVTTENGKRVLRSSKTDRAWKILSEKHWRIKKYAVDIFTDVVEYLANKHDDGSEKFFEIAETNFENYISFKNERRFRSNKKLKDSEYYLNTSNSTGEKRLRLENLSRLVIHQGAAIKLEELVCVWLPEQ